MAICSQSNFSIIHTTANTIRLPFLSMGHTQQDFEVIILLFAKVWKKFRGYLSPSVSTKLISHLTRHDTIIHLHYYDDIPVTSVCNTARMTSRLVSCIHLQMILNIGKYNRGSDILNYLATCVAFLILEYISVCKVI